MFSVADRVLEDALNDGDDLAEPFRPGGLVQQHRTLIVEDAAVVDGDTVESVLQPSDFLRPADDSGVTDWLSA